MATRKGTPGAHGTNRRELNQSLRPACGHPHNLTGVGQAQWPPGYSRNDSVQFYAHVLVRIAASGFDQGRFCYTPRVGFPNAAWLRKQLALSRSGAASVYRPLPRLGLTKRTTSESNALRHVLELHQKDGPQYRHLVMSSSRRRRSTSCICATHTSLFLMAKSDSGVCSYPRGNPQRRHGCTRERSSLPRANT